MIQIIALVFAGGIVSLVLFPVALFIVVVALDFKYPYDHFRPTDGDW